MNRTSKVILMAAVSLLLCTACAAKKEKSKVKPPVPVKVARALLKDVPGVERVEEIQAHRFGPYLVVNLTIGVDGMMSVVQGDVIASKVEEKLYRNIDLLRRVHVHYHPYNLTLTPADFMKDYIEPAK